ncbi:hypothetical protein Pint_15801 [Pistacia integerrima]|uniref:Uncharacterized protein n=1 Tax=Pistacia integerrima TaxID=434235 RepID=A0ACC0ZFI5_9ROSI|nr:hypothetical protein Pint_15801 [Pistacia integerrima]
MPKVVTLTILTP